MFVDQATIYCKAGNGGNGCQSFYRDRSVRKGKPDGGDGGSGGDVFIEVDNNVQTLLYFQFNKNFKAQSGGHGSSNNRNGRDGDNIILRVPPGTIIKEAESDLILRDLTDIGQRIRVCQGGDKGKGNSRFRMSTRGSAGEERQVRLELKLMADIGLVGFPNAGKSTLVRALSKARPKVAPYPFTTRAPILGAVSYHDHSFTIADIPGLIEGAHKGRGLGDRFLKHIERTSVLAHLIDMSSMDSTPVTERYDMLMSELENYSESLVKKKIVLIASKMDFPESEGNLAILKKHVKEPVFPISAVENIGMSNLLDEFFDKVSEVRKV